MKDKIKVIIVDDSATVRQVLKEVLSQDSKIDVTSIASDPVIALKMMQSDWPDVIITDIEMPKMDGISFTKKIMSERPTPIVVCSALTGDNAKLSMEAMAAGAVEVISKPKVGTKDFLYESGVAITDSVKSAAKANLDKVVTADSKTSKFASPKLSADAMLPPARKKVSGGVSENIIAIGASAGGTQTIEYILKVLNKQTTGIVIVQHMPETFTEAFANRLNSVCDIYVKEAVDNEIIERGKVLIAPGNKHMLVEKYGEQFRVRIKDGPLVSRHRPSVDVLFRSVSKYGGKNILGIILTGMGDDGATGMVEMKKMGITTIAQSKESCIVYGMPKMAIERGGAVKILSLDAICSEIITFSNQFNR